MAREVFELGEFPDQSVRVASTAPRLGLGCSREGFSGQIEASVSPPDFDSATVPVNPIEFESFEATLQHIVDLACSAIAHCSMAGMTLLDQTGPHTAVATSEVAGRVDKAQYDAKSGPCLDAYRHQEVKRIPSTRTDEQWPTFSRHAAENGVLSTLSEPLLVNGDGIGALNLYGDRERAVDADDERLAGVLATHASITLANAQAYWRNERLRQNLEAALETRGVIERAKGVLMVREGLTSEEAMDFLRHASQRANRKVHEMATDVVASTQLRETAIGDPV